jgi:hypothetical protein
MVVGYVDVGDRGEDSGRSPVKATRLIVAVAPPQAAGLSGEAEG